MNRRIFTLLTLLSLALLLPVLSYGQAISGDMVGTVKDASGAFVPNATVVVTNLGTAAKQTTQTNAQGEYHFSNLPAGHYSVDVTATGMSGGYRDIEVQLNKVATANITTAVVSAGTTVEVNEQAVAIDTTTQNISNVFESKTIADSAITSTGSGVINLSLLNAGVASSGGIGVGSGPSVSGQRPRNNNFTVEGVDNNSKSVTGPLIQVPNDAVDSFTVLQNQFSPEFGHSSGGQFNQTIKSGTNQYHGRLYEYFQNRNLNAQDSQNALAEVSNGQTPSNPRYDNNRFGGQVGGPILKNKLFFFSDWEYNPVGQVTSSSACAPTSAGYAMLNGLSGVNQTNLQQFEKYVPASPTQAGPNDQLCAPTSSVLGTSIPVGDVGFAGNNYQNFLTTMNSVDWNISEKDQVRGRLGYEKENAIDYAGQIPAFWAVSPTRYWLVTLSEYHNFGTNINNEFRFGFNRFSNTTPVGSQTFPGLGGVFPNININEFNGIQLGPDGNAPQFGIQNLYQFVDNLSWIKGKHQFRYGGEFRWYISPQGFTQRVRGDYEWNTFEGYLTDISPDYFGERSVGNETYYGNQKAVYAYANDSWRITQNFTLNYGLRYEWTGVPLSEEQWQPLNSISNVPGLISFNAPTSQKTNFLPRVGFNYAPGNGTMSIRGGFGMAVDVLYDNLGLLSAPPQVQQTCDVGSPSATCFYSNSAFLASGGLPFTSTIPPGSPVFTDPATARSATSGYIPNQQLPYSENWNLGIQKEFDNKYTLSVTYVGTKGIHLPVQDRINRASPVNAVQNLPTYLSAPSQATLDSLPYTLAYLKTHTGDGTACGSSNCGSYSQAYLANGFASNMTAFMPWGSSNYNGLQVQLQRNFTNGLQFQLSYTWSHALDNSTADVFSTWLTPRRPQDFGCVSCDYSTSALNRAQRLTFAATYDAPWFKNDNWVKKNLLGNWQISPVFTYQSPEYATVNSGGTGYDSNLNRDTAGDRSIINYAGVAGTSSDVTPLTNSNGAVVAYVANNPNAYYIAAGSGAYATAQRNTLSINPIDNLDLSILKRLNITERQNLEFQAQFLNLFNHAQYLPGYISDVAPLGYTGSNVLQYLSPGSPSFNTANQVFTNHPRQLVLVVKYNF